MAASEPELKLIDISACKQDRNEISMAKPMFSGSGCPIRVVGIIFRPYWKWEIQDGGLQIGTKTDIHYMPACRQDRNGNPTAKPMGWVGIMFDHTESGKSKKVYPISFRRYITPGFTQCTKTNIWIPMDARG